MLKFIHAFQRSEELNIGDINFRLCLKKIAAEIAAFKTISGNDMLIDDEETWEAVGCLNGVDG